jgi:hypothetical protein
MTIHLNTQNDLEDAVNALVKLDPRLGPILDLTGMPALRRREPGFAGLAAIVCGQQLSTASAAAIADSPPPSIRFITTPSSVPAPIGWDGWDYRPRKSRP